MPGDAGNCVQLDSGTDTTATAENETVNKHVRRALQKMGLIKKRAKNVNKSYVRNNSYWHMHIIWQTDFSIVIQGRYSRRDDMLGHCWRHVGGVPG